MTVHLVGAGPGDPGLITVRGLELLRALRRARPRRARRARARRRGTRRCARGLASGDDSGRVDELLVQLGRAGLDVVRLKGGDPFVFGRGGEEALALAAAGLAFEVVPGVSSIAAVPAAALVPVTHRGIADRVTLASGRGADGGEPDYEALVAGGGTIVLFMGLERLAQLCTGLDLPACPQRRRQRWSRAGRYPIRRR